MIKDELFKYKHLALIINNNLIGVLSYSVVSKKGIAMIYIYLIGINPYFQGKNVGTKLMKFIMEKYRKVVLWADNDSVSFYKKLNFQKDKKLYKELSQKISYFESSEFMFYGLTNDEIKLIKSDVPDLKLMSQTKNIDLINSITFALHNRKFSDDLNFPKKVKYLNELSKKNVQIFNKMKINTTKKQYGPLIIKYNEDWGFFVEATDFIACNTLVCEYSGDVILHDDCSNDLDIMGYIIENDIEYAISPKNCCNIARFILGINNNDFDKIQNQNLASALCNIKGEAHIILYTIKNIKAGDILYYDYNSGGLNEFETKDFK